MVPQERPNDGRPTKYERRFSTWACKLCELGATDREISEFFAISESTLKLWKSVHPTFSAAFKRGKQAADDRVERSLYNR